MYTLDTKLVYSCITEVVCITDKSSFHEISLFCNTTLFGFYVLQYIKFIIYILEPLFELYIEKNRHVYVQKLTENGAKFQTLYVRSCAIYFSVHILKLSLLQYSSKQWIKYETSNVYIYRK